MKIYCPECKALQKVVYFRRDDPVLSCGHTKERNAETDKIEDISRRALEEEAKLRGMTYEEIQDELIKEVLEFYQNTEPTTYCPICDEAVCYFLGKNNEHRCGGNMINNPGCGSLVKETIHQV